MATTQEKTPKPDTQGAQATTADDAQQQGGVGDAVKERLEAARESLSDGAEAAVEGAKRLESRAEECVRERPMTSLLVAAGVSAGLGALLGYLVTRE